MKVTTALAALLIVGTAAFATDGNSDEKKAKNSKVAIINNSQAKYKLVYMGEAKEKITLRVKDENGKVVDTRTVRNDGGFAQPYNFESLPSGEYTFEITTADGNKETQVIEHIKKKTEDTATKSLKGNILNINDGRKYRLVALSDDVKPISVKIYGDNNTLLHSETVANTNGFRKVFDLEDVEADNIRFELESGKESISMTAQ